MQIEIVQTTANNLSKNILNRIPTKVTDTDRVFRAVRNRRTVGTAVVQHVTNGASRELQVTFDPKTPNTVYGVLEATIREELAPLKRRMTFSA
jgi:hypothetical protein